jgi:Fe-S cluster biogenesis protein NfuA
MEDASGAAVSPVLAGLGAVPDGAGEFAAGAVVEGEAVEAAVEVGDAEPLLLSEPHAARATTSAAGTSAVHQRVAICGDARAEVTGSSGHPSRMITPETRANDVREQVEETIEAIRPALQADGGDIFLRDVDEASGVVSVTLVGACGTCPVSTDTLKAGIERIMRDRVDGVTEVVAV